MLYKDTISIEKVRRTVAGQPTFRSSAVDYLSSAWEVIQKNMGDYVGFTFLFFGISVALGFAGEVIKDDLFIVSAILDILSNILNLVILPGYYIYTYKLLHSKYPEFSDFWGGFQYIGQLILQAIIASFFYLLVLVPIGIFAFVIMDFSGFNVDPSGGTLLIMLALGFVIFIIFFLLYASWLFAPMLIIFSRVGIWEAMESSRKVAFNNIGTIIVLFILHIILGILGLLTCCIGFLWLLPVMYVCYYLMFDDIFELDKEIDEMDNIIEHLL